MNHRGFLSCDWGTSAIRLHLVNETSNLPETTVETAEGISGVHRAWRTAGAVFAEREQFYLDVVRRHVLLLARETGRSLSDFPIVMSGMASASVGLHELPYRELPFVTDGSELHFETRLASARFPHPLMLISGVRASDDVMRGEETQLVGTMTNQTVGDGLFIFPGTHSKHVDVRNFRAIALRTYMTGEFFDLLSRQSILGNSIEAGHADSEETVAAFSDGVATGIRENLLRASFGVRVDQIFERRSRRAGYQYLSGLVLGAELRDLPPRGDSPITLVGNPTLVARYHQALQELNWRGALTTVPADSAIIAGQRGIATSAGFLPATS